MGNPFTSATAFTVSTNSPIASSQPYLQSKPAGNGEGEQQQQEPQETDEAVAETGGPALRCIWGQKSRSSHRIPAGLGRTTSSTVCHEYSGSCAHFACLLLQRLPIAI